MSKRLPEIFIVGTMKGGTTILYDYLATHPRVTPGLAKEIHYFSLYSDRGLSWYLDHFPDRDETVFSLDASPTYFDVADTPSIPGFIKAAVPNAKILLIVRDPIERAISHFNHLKLVSHKDAFVGIDINDFFSRPISGCYTKSTPQDVHLDHVLSFSLYQFKFYYYRHAFGPENILVLRNEDLRTRPIETMERVFAHCGLEWVASDLFGQQRYVAGSDKLRLERHVHERLADLFYLNFKAFCAAAGVPYSERAFGG